MNYSFKLSDVSINIPSAEAEINIGNMEISVQDLDIKDSFQFMRELPGLIVEIRKATEMPIGAPIVDMEKWNQQQEPNDHTGYESGEEPKHSLIHLDQVNVNMLVSITLTANRVAAGRVSKITKHHVTIEGYEHPFPKTEIEMILFAGYAE